MKITYRDPADFRRGFGLVGILIQVTNAIRIWAEKRMRLLILRAQMRDEYLEADFKVATPTERAWQPTVLVSVNELAIEKAVAVPPKEEEEDLPLRPVVPFEQGELRDILAQVNVARDRSLRHIGSRRLASGQILEFEPEDTKDA
jgi:hypothetical protein